MRSHRTQKKMIKAASTTVSFADDFTFSKYENYTVAEEDISADTAGFVQIGAYAKPADMTGEANAGASIKAVSNFSEDLKYWRRHCMRTNAASTFTVNLVYEKNETDDKKGKCVNIVFTYKKDNTTGATEPLESIKMNVKVQDPADSSKTLTLETPDLDLDSDITEYLFRFTKGLSWGSVTYGILDCNPNESVNKGIYLTMNAPFNGSIKWGDEVRKLILAYKLPSSI